MALLHIAFEEIGEQHLQRLLAARVAESRDIEYKRTTYGEADADKAECLADLSSFANTTGGDVLIGIDAKNGAPLALAPLSSSADAEILRIEDLVRSSLQPRIALRCKAIPIAAGGYVLMVRVPRSYNPPHRLVRAGKGQFRFYARSSAGKYEPNVDELRTLFSLAPNLAERLRDFRSDRIAKIAAGSAPVPLQGQDCIALHIVPLSAFSLGASVPLDQVVGDHHSFPPMGSRSAPHRVVNFDGALKLSNADGAARPQRAYVQVFRTGTVEAVYSGFANRNPPSGRPIMTAKDIEGNTLLNGLKYLKSLVQIGLEPPFAILLSLLNVKGLTIAYERSAWMDEDDVTTVDRDQLHFSDVVIDAVPNSIQDFAALIRPVIEQLANTAGLPASPSFDANTGYYLHAWGY